MNDESSYPVETDAEDRSLLPSEPGEMAFLDHLEEMRWRILRSLIAILLGAIVCFALSDSVMQLLIKPYEEAVLSLENQRSPGVVSAVQSLVGSWLGTQQEVSDPASDVAEIPPARGNHFGPEDPLQPPL